MHMGGGEATEAGEMSNGQDVPMKEHIDGLNSFQPAEGSEAPAARPDAVHEQREASRQSGSAAAAGEPDLWILWQQWAQWAAGAQRGPPMQPPHGSPVHSLPPPTGHPHRPPHHWPPPHPEHLGPPFCPPHGLHNIPAPFPRPHHPGHWPFHRGFRHHPHGGWPGPPFRGPPQHPHPSEFPGETEGSAFIPPPKGVFVERTSESGSKAGKEAEGQHSCRDAESSRDDGETPAQAHFGPPPRFDPSPAVPPPPGPFGFQLFQRGPPEEHSLPAHSQPSQRLPAGGASGSDTASEGQRSQSGGQLSTPASGDSSGRKAISVQSEGSEEGSSKKHRLAAQEQPLPSKKGRPQEPAQSQGALDPRGSSQGEGPTVALLTAELAKHSMQAASLRPLAAAAPSGQRHPNGPSLARPGADGGQGTSPRIQGVSMETDDAADRSSPAMAGGPAAQGKEGPTDLGQAAQGGRESPQPLQAQPLLDRLAAPLVLTAQRAQTERSAPPAQSASPGRGKGSAASAPVPRGGGAADVLLTLGPAGSARAVRRRAAHRAVSADGGSVRSAASGADPRVTQFMEQAGLGAYTALLTDAWVDMDELPGLSSQELRQLGLPEEASRRLRRALDPSPPTGDPEMVAFLEGLGLGQFAPVLGDAWVEMAELRSMEERELLQLGLPLGAAKRLLRGIARAERSSASKGAISMAPHKGRGAAPATHPSVLSGGALEGAASSGAAQLLRRSLVHGLQPGRSSGAGAPWKEREHAQRTRPRAVEGAPHSAGGPPQTGGASEGPSAPAAVRTCNGAWRGAEGHGALDQAKAVAEALAAARAAASSGAAEPQVAGAMSELALAAKALLELLQKQQN